MMGAARLFAERRVRIVNFEFNPVKHFAFQRDMRRAAALGPESPACRRGNETACRAVDAAAAYLSFLDQHGFDLYLFSCVPPRSLAHVSSVRVAMCVFLARLALILMRMCY